MRKGAHTSLNVFKTYQVPIKPSHLRVLRFLRSQEIGEPETMGNYDMAASTRNHSGRGFSNQPPQNYGHHQVQNFQDASEDDEEDEDEQRDFDDDEEQQDPLSMNYDNSRPKLTNVDAFNYAGQRYVDRGCRGGGQNFDYRQYEGNTAKNNTSTYQKNPMKNVNNRNILKERTNLRNEDSDSMELPEPIIKNSKFDKVLSPVKSQICDGDLDISLIGTLLSNNENCRPSKTQGQYNEKIKRRSGEVLNSSLEKKMKDKDSVKDSSPHIINLTNDNYWNSSKSDKEFDALLSSVATKRDVVQKSLPETPKKVEMNILPNENAVIEETLPNISAELGAHTSVLKEMSSHLQKVGENSCHLKVLGELEVHLKETKVQLQEANALLKESNAQWPEANNSLGFIAMALMHKAGLTIVTNKREPNNNNSGEGSDVLNAEIKEDTPA